MAASLWSHYVFDKQQSVCRLKIQKGQDSMQVGWRVSLITYLCILTIFSYLQ